MTRILIVEDEPNMVAGLRDNFEYEGYEVVTAGDGAEGLQRALDDAPDLVVLDPPRAGAEKSTLKYLVDLQPRRIHYVACHPPTWARDLAFLLSRNYRMEEVEMFDCFPHTYHIECLARLVRQDQATR